MMKFIEKVGNIKVYEERHSENDTTITFMNGSDIVAREVYSTSNTSAAVADLFTKKLDTYTEEWLWLNCLTNGLIKLSNNTYKTSDTDWFCRIGDTRYFKHFNKSDDEFVTDKNGMRIIER